MGSSPNSRHSGYIMLSPWVKLQSSSFLMTRMDQNTDATPDLNTESGDCPTTFSSERTKHSAKYLAPATFKLGHTACPARKFPACPGDSFAKIRKPMPCDSSCNAGACRAGV